MADKDTDLFLKISDVWLLVYLQDNTLCQT